MSNTARQSIMIYGGGDMPGTAISVRTWAVLTFGLVASSLSLALVRLDLKGATLLTGTIANLGSLLTVGLAAAVALWAAMRFGSHESTRKQWLFIGLGMLSYFLGDAAWAYSEAVLGAAIPYPGLPDIFYLLMYPLTAIGLVLAIRSLRAVLSLRKPLLIAGLTTIVVMIAFWLPVFRPTLTETAGLARILSLLYPLSDLWLLVFPALTLALLLSELAGGRLSWPWWLVVSGYLLFVFADTMFVVLTSTGAYATGNPLDLGWWFGCTAIAVGASLAVDMLKPNQTDTSRA